MQRSLVIVLAIAMALPFPLRAQTDVAAVLAASTAAMGAANLQSIRYSGTGASFPTGQAFASGGPWPRFTVTKYTMSVNYATPAMRQELVRVDDARPPRGGGAGGFNPATGQGGIRPVPGDIIVNQTTDGRTETGAVAVWLTPHGFLKGAAVNAATLMVSTRGGKRELSFTAFGKYTVTATLSGQHLVERVQAYMDVAFTGDTLFEGLYSNYRDIAGVQWPMHIVQRQGGHPTLELTVADVQPNGPVAIEVPAAPPAIGGPPPGPRVAPEKIATVAAKRGYQINEHVMQDQTARMMMDIGEREKNLGTLEAGKLADLLVLDRDDMTIPVDDMRNVTPLVTMVGGKIVHEVKR